MKYNKPWRPDVCQNAMASPARYLHWNWDGGQAAILHNWIRSAANNAAAFPLPIRGGRRARGGCYFPCARGEIYLKRNKNYRGHRVTQRKWNQSETSVFLRVLCGFTTIRSIDIGKKILVGIPPPPCICVYPRSSAVPFSCAIVQYKL